MEPSGPGRYLALIIFFLSIFGVEATFRGLKLLRESGCQGENLPVFYTLFDLVRQLTVSIGDAVWRRVVKIEDSPGLPSFTTGGSVLHSGLCLIDDPWSAQGS